MVSTAVVVVVVVVGRQGVFGDLVDWSLFPGRTHPCGPSAAVAGGWRKEGLQPRRTAKRCRGDDGV
jgi:hypothetical protein